ncbi:MAG TPA: hypothetical protein PK098_07965 [Phycisphaerales bacterium]|nr:hypothetical protein [Phycisphaerales bacterium]
MNHVIDQLEQIRRRSRAMLVLQRASVVLAWAIGIMLALIALDYLLRLPSAFRLVTLILGSAALLYTFHTRVWSAARFRPSLTQLALRVERVFPAVAGRLASSVEFAAAGVDQTNALAAHSVRETESRLASSGSAMRSIIDPRRTLRDLTAFFVAATICGAFIFISPASAQTGFTRLLLPYSATKWPARTGVESLMNEVVSPGGVHPRGQALPLRARVTRGDASQRVMAHYRLRTAGAFGPWQQALLTQQAAHAGRVHERLIDSSADGIELYFTTQDDETEIESITIVPPPAVRRASVSIAPPEYAAARVPTRDMELGPGLDSRAVTETASLVGSDVELHFTFNKALPVAPEAAHEAWLRRTLGWHEGDLPRFAVDPQDGRRWSLRWTLDQTRALTLDLMDEHGLRNTEPIVYRIEAASDAPPSVTLMKPQADEAVLASAIVPLAAEAQDDVAVSSLAVEARLQRAGDPRVPDMEHQPLWHYGGAETIDSPLARLETSLSLPQLPMKLAEGDVLHVVAVATDNFEQEGEARGPSYSASRRLRIIGELEFATQMRRQLGVVRQNAIRMETLQAELQESISEDGVQPGVERAQAQLTERIAAQREAVEELAQQMERNRLDDRQLESLLQQSRDLLDFAGRAANRATEAIGSPASRSENEAEREAAQQDIAEAQQEVRDELADLIELLDRDEDTWVVTRRLEGLMEEQSRLAEATAQLADRTVGQSLSDLSREDLTELDRIARRQRELRDEARQLIDNLRERAQSMENVDQRAASGMRNAARTGEQRELDRDMQNAAERAAQNQLRAAQQGQQQAAQTMQRMLQEMQETQQARAEQLLRQLASLIESIDRLIFVQENEIVALARAVEDGDFTGRDRSMIRLNQNTQAVAGEARAAGQQSRRIARSLDRAADAQGAAAVALRAEPIDVPAAERAEERSLELLREARALAEELQQQAREDEVRRRREELIASYRVLAERQVMLREQTLELHAAGPAAGAPLDRRQLMEARRYSTNQDEIRTALEEIERNTTELMEAAVFRHAHRRMNEWSEFATLRLVDGDVGVAVTDRQQLIAQTIGRLIEALEEAATPPEEFDEGRQDEEGEGDQEGQETPLIPPVAELRLLRGLQEEVYNQTRSLDERRDLDAADRTERLRDLGAQQRDLLDLGRQMLERLQRRAPQ